MRSLNPKISQMPPKIKLNYLSPFNIIDTCVVYLQFFPSKLQTVSDNFSIQLEF